MTAENMTAQATTPETKGGILKTWAETLLRPASFFAAIREERRFGPPLGFAYAMVAAGWVVTTLSAATGVTPLGKQSLASMLISTTLLSLKLPLEAGFVGGLVLAALSRMLGGTEGTYKQSFGIGCYSMAVYPLGCLVGLLGRLISPSLGTVVPGMLLLYGVYVAATGVVVVHRSKQIPTFILFGLIALGFMWMEFRLIHGAATHTANVVDTGTAPTWERSSP